MSFPSKEFNEHKHNIVVVYIVLSFKGYKTINFINSNSIFLVILIKIVLKVIKKDFFVDVEKSFILFKFIIITKIKYFY